MNFSSTPSIMSSALCPGKSCMDTYGGSMSVPSGAPLAPGECGKLGVWSLQSLITSAALLGVSLLGCVHFVTSQVVTGQGFGFPWLMKQWN